MQATPTSFRPSRNSLIATALLVLAAFAAGAAMFQRPGPIASSTSGAIDAAAPILPVGDLHATRDPSVPSAKSVFDDSHGAIEEPPATH